GIVLINFNPRFRPRAGSEFLAIGICAVPKGLDRSRALPRTYVLVDLNFACGAVSSRSAGRATNSPSKGSEPYRLPDFAEACGDMPRSGDSSNTSGAALPASPPDFQPEFPPMQPFCAFPAPARLPC